jgi:Carboxypeptidase regulatory-like domain/TonB-dependent Receptor Plug Domain
MIRTGSNLGAGVAAANRRSLGSRIADAARWAAVLALLICCFGVFSTSAQLYTGSVTGVVTDSSGASVPSAKVTLLDQDKGTTSTVTTDAEGRYLFRSVAPGTYTVSVEAAGLEAQRQTGINLNVSQNVSADFALKVGAAAIVVDVHADTVQLATEDATTGQVIDRKFIEELPLVSRNVLDLVSLAPGVTPVNNSQSGPNSDNFISNGGRNNTADILIDGVSVTNFEPNSGILQVLYTPSVDAVQEFKVQQTNFSSEFGFSGGTVINLVSRSGSNQFHGGLYEFNRNAALEANSFFNNLNHQAISPLSRNNFGGTFGGPIRKNKTFFFFDYEGLRQTTGDSRTAGVPTAAERNGDFGIKCTIAQQDIDPNSPLFNQTVMGHFGDIGNGNGQCLDPNNRPFTQGQLYDPYTGQFDGSANNAYGPGIYRSQSAFIPNNNIAAYTSANQPNCLGPTFGACTPRNGPGNLIDPAAAKFFQLFPNPTPTLANPTRLAGLQNNFFFAGSDTLSNNQFDIKVDQRFTENEQLSVRYSQQRSLTNTLNCFGNAADPCTSGPVISPSHLVAINNTYVISPRVVFTASYGFSRNAPNEPGPLSVYPNVNPISTLGLPSYIGASGSRAFPEITLNSYAQPGGANIGTSPFTILHLGSDAHTLIGGISWIKGKHEIKFGAEGRLHRLNFAFNFWPGGFQNFDFSGTSQASASPISGGDSLASFLIGSLATGGFNGVYTINSQVSTQSFQGAGYIQDNYHFSRKLTVNIGLRYELSTPRTERFNKAQGLSTSVLTGLSVPLTPGSAPTVLRGGEVFATPNDRTTYPTNFKNFGPRFGFAYQLPHTFVVRGGYGIYFSTSRSSAGGNGAFGNDGYSSFTPVFATSFADQATPFSSVSNPFPFGIQRPAGSSLGAQNNLGQDVSGAVSGINEPTPYEQSWSFGVQKQLPWKVIVDATYVGKRGTHLYYAGAGNLDFLPESLFRSLTAGVTDPNTLKANVAPLLQNVANPFFSPTGQTPISQGGTCDTTRYICNFSPLGGNGQIKAFQLLLPYPQFTSFSSDSPPVGNSIYHAAQFRAEKQFSNGLQVLLTYTFSKSIDNSSGTSDGITSFLGGQTSLIDPNNRNLERAISSFDIPHLFTGSYVYQLPIGKGGLLLPHVNRIVNGFIGGWQTQGIVTFSSGTPILPFLANGSIPFPTFGQRPDLNGTLQCNPAPIGGDLNAYNYFANSNVLATPANYTLGTAPRTITSCRNPGIKNADLAVSKQFGLTNLREGSHLEFRFETFNTLNRVQFAGPNTGVNSGQIGHISAQANNPRELQLGLKFYW